jgi:hypothetical protein
MKIKHKGSPISKYLTLSRSYSLEDSFDTWEVPRR